MPAESPIPLSRATLAALPPAVARPAYDLDAVTAGIVHLGPGVFHRAHMARYTHDAMAISPDAAAWGIVGAGLRPPDRRIADALGPQDGLYTLVEWQEGFERATVIGALREVIYAGGSTALLLARIDDPAIRIVSLTVSEDGYCLDPATRQLDRGHPAIVGDLAGGSPTSAPGVIVEALRRRRAAGQPAFTVLSCDNIQHNGAVLRAAVLALAECRDAGLAAWIADHATFPATMVDRITPATTDADIADVAARFGVADRWPVSSELFRQWVIEDQFAAGHPPWEAAGAQFVADVAPYETMKLRLLNASHLALAGLGQLAGYTFVAEAMRDDVLRAYLRALIDRDIAPTVPPVPGVDLRAYGTQLMTRFANPHIADTLQRIATDAALNLLLDPLRDRVAAGAPCELLALGLAAWMRRLREVDDRGRPIAVTHPHAATLRERAARGGTDPRPLLELRSLFGDLGDRPPLVDALTRSLVALDRYGSRGAIERTLTAVRSS